MGRRFNTKRKTVFFLLCLLLSAFLAGCGRKEEDNGYYIIETETEQLFTNTQLNADVFVLGSRFYEGIPVLLAGYRARDLETGEKYVDVRLCRESGDEEILWERVPEEYGYGSWYLDRDGNGYCLYVNQVIRYDQGGGERYRKTCEDVMLLVGACMPNKGNILLLGQTQQGMLNLLELNADTGEITRTGVTLDTESVGLQGKTAIAGDGNGFLVLDSSGIWEADTKKGRKDCIMSFVGGTYTPSAVSDFRISQDGTAEILCGSNLETVRCVDISRGRKRLVLRMPWKISDSIFTSGWLPEEIVRFNKENGEYYVVVVWPYMEAFGIFEGDYFPAAIESLRGDGVQGDGTGIYGINIMLFPDTGRWVIRELFPEGMDSGLDAEGLINALEAYEGNAVYTGTSSMMLYDLLKASDSLCGMVDWENGTCDFTNGMLKRLLEVCGRYASGSGKDTKALSGRMQSSLYVYANIYGNEDEMEERGMWAMGCLFDDGQHAGIDDVIQLSISSASTNKAGAWEFVRFLLSEEEQSRISWVDNDFIYPSNRKAFEALAAKEIADGTPWPDMTMADGTTYKRQLMGNFWTDVPSAERERYYALTEEKVERVRRMLEGARAYPLRTEPIRTIIDEEAAAYFAGDRSVDDVCANIQNRVQLYLNEHLYCSHNVFTSVSVKPVYSSKKP